MQHPPHRLPVLSMIALGLLGLIVSCARLPYTTKVVHEDRRVVVALERDFNQLSYSHPVQITGPQLKVILEGFSFRPTQRMPLRWYAEEDPPKPVFRPDELEALTDALSQGLATARPEERVRFLLRAPGFNPHAQYDVVGGWVAVREPYFYLTLEYVHAQVPVHKFDPYDYNYPTPPQLPADYLLYFEPGRFWVTDQQGMPALEYREALKTPRRVVPTDP